MQPHPQEEVQPGDQGHSQAGGRDGVHERAQGDLRGRPRRGQEGQDPQDEELVRPGVPRQQGNDGGHACAPDDFDAADNNEPCDTL